MLEASAQATLAVRATSTGKMLTNLLKSRMDIILFSASALLFSFIVGFSEAAAPEKNGRNILIFGGNGFIGSYTVERLIERGDNIAVVHRGGWRWDGEQKIAPHVKFYKCDRERRIEECNDLMVYINSTKFDFVVDFSAYRKFNIEQSTKALKGRVKLYVYISTDSVYDVCAHKSHDGALLEADSVRPEDDRERDQLANYHGYGNRKMEAEEVLLAQREDDGIPYVILRPPDVIGPRDSTFRWPSYQLWAKVSSEFDIKKLVIPQFLHKYPISFVYVEDLADAILAVLDKYNTVGLQDEIFNVAWPEPVTLDHLLTTLAIGMSNNDSKTVFIHMDNSHSTVLYFYPSVRCGPINSTKAVKMLDWKPRPFEQAVNETAAFYQRVMSEPEFYDERNGLIQIVANQIFTHEKMEFYDAIESIYKVDLRHFKYPRDEL